MELSLRAEQDHVEKVAKTRDDVKALAEFVWNALDADASSISVRLVRNGLGGIDAIQIDDDGIGISYERAQAEFENLGGSWKRDQSRTQAGRVLHGKEGKGRFRFFSISDHARWKSIYADETGQLRRIDIHIAAEALKRSLVSEPKDADRPQAGTSVTLQPLKSGHDWLTTERARSEFAAIFSPYLLQYPQVSIVFDGHSVDPKTTILRDVDLPAQPVMAGDRLIDDLKIKIIEWRSLSESRRIHFGAEQGIVLGSQPANVTAPGFEFSAYATSSLFQEMSDANLLELDDLTDPAFGGVVDHIRQRLSSYFRSRQAERARGLIDELKDAGAYPYVGDPANDLERREREVFDIATYAVSSYSPDFKKAENSLKRMTLTLLKEAVRHNPDALTTILQAVVKLPKSRQDEFSSLLKHTELGNIIGASSLLAERVMVLETLKAIVFDPEHKATIRERGGLDVIVRDNTWLFGERFHITLSEAGLSRVMDRVAADQDAPSRRRVVRKPGGGQGRVDCFLGRSVPQSDHLRKEYLVVELKRPSIAVGREELDQVEDYVNALISQPDWSRTVTEWHFFLVSGVIDDQIIGRVTQKDRPAGLFLEGDNYEIWVKTWGEVIRECEARIQFIQDELKYDVSNSEIESRIGALKRAFTKEEAERAA